MNDHNISGLPLTCTKTHKLANTTFGSGNIGHAGVKAKLQREGGRCSATTIRGYTEGTSGSATQRFQGVICSSTPDRAYLEILGVCRKTNNELGPLQQPIFTLTALLNAHNEGGILRGSLQNEEGDAARGGGRKGSPKTQLVLRAFTEKAEEYGTATRHLRFCFEVL